VPVFCYGLGFTSSIFLAPVLINKFGIRGAAVNANLSYLLMLIAICSSFLAVSKLNFKRFISFKEDIRNLKDLMFPLHAKV